MSCSGIEILSTETVNQIIDEAVGALNNPGIKIDNQEAIQILDEAGCMINYKNNVVSIPEKLVTDSIKTTPSKFFLYDLFGNQSVSYGGDEIHFDPGSTAIFFLDRTTGGHRQPVTEDYIDMVKVVESLPQLDAQSTAMVCKDVPEVMGDWYRLFLSLNLMGKPIITGAFTKDTWWIMWEMLVLVAGGEHALAEKPIAVFDVCPSPPLSWSDLTCQNLIDCAKKRIPAELVSMPLAGATAPVTLAGAVVQHTAENLSGIVIHQLTNPGAPIIWGGSPSIFDMKHGTTPMGAAGTWLIDAAYVQVGKYLNLPTHVYMGMSDAKVNDMQSGLESMGGAMAAALSGANMISGAGMLDFETCQSLEKLVIDAEIIGLVKRFVKGIEIREKPIGLSIIRDMGHLAGYLSLQHTRKWFRDEFYIPSGVIDRGSYDAWITSGSKPIQKRASERIDQLLESYEQPELSPDIRRELRSTAEYHAKKLGLEYLPYTFEI